MRIFIKDAVENTSKVITIQKLKTYQKYKGKLFLLQNEGTIQEKDLIKEEEFLFIGSFIDDLILARTGKCSELFLESVNATLVSKFDKKSKILLNAIVFKTRLKLFFNSIRFSLIYIGVIIFSVIVFLLLYWLFNFLIN